MKLTLKRILFTILTILFTLFLYSFIPTPLVHATNVLTNPSFTGGTTGWTLSSSTYSSTTYQDSAGSVHGFAGRKTSTTAIITQNSYFSNSSINTVYLSGWHTVTIGGNGDATLYIEREEQSTPGTWVELWNSGSITVAYTWTQINNLNVSTSFGTGSYRIRIRMELNGGASVGAGIDAYFDNLNLDVIPPNITVGTTGTQVTSLQQSSTNEYVGGAFTFIRNSGSTSVTSITISETGTIADTNISGLILYYKQEATCSTSIPVDATQFNSTPGSFSSGSSTVTGTMTVGTSQICMYAEVDIGSGAQVDDTVEIQITNPSTQVTATLGTVSPATSVVISGTTTIVGAGTLSIDIVDGTDTPVANPSVSMSSTSVSFTNQTSTGTLGTSSEKVYMTSDSTTNWQVSIAATDGSIALWSNAGANTYYDFNDSTANAQDGADTDVYGGQLTVDSSVGTLTPGSGCSNTGLSLGSSSSFVEGSNDSITLVTATSADTNCSWYLTGISLSQSIPEEQLSDSYSIDLTLTIVSV
jgi:hypothetical protein